MAASLNNISLVLSAVCIAVALIGNQAEAFDPIVETGVSKLAEQGRHVAVHVPGFFNMNMDTRGPGNGVRMSQSVMSGLVNIFMDREKQGDSFTGPIRVKVGGITMYDNGQPNLASSEGAELTDLPSQVSGMTSRLGSFLRRQNSAPAAAAAAAAAQQ